MNTYTIGQSARVLRNAGAYGTILESVTVIATDCEAVTFRASDGWRTTLAGAALNDYALPGLDLMGE